MQVYPDPNNPNTQFLGAEEISKKKVKKTMKEIDGDPKLRTKREIVQHLGKGTSIQGYARQEKILCMDDGYQQVRFVLFDVYRHGSLHHFAIPIALMATQPPLPTLPLSKDELKLLYTIAEVLLDTPGRTEKILFIKRPEQVTVKLSRDQALLLSFKEELVANRLEHNPWILSTLARSIC